MPGPVSDSYDPVWGTSSSREDLIDSLNYLDDRIGTEIGPDLKNIISVIQSTDVEPDEEMEIPFKEWELRLIRFAVRQTLRDLKERDVDFV